MQDYSSLPQGPKRGRRTMNNEQSERKHYGLWQVMKKMLPAYPIEYFPSMKSESDIVKEQAQ